MLEKRIIILNDLISKHGERPYDDGLEILDVVDINPTIKKL